MYFLGLISQMILGLLNQYLFHPINYVKFKESALKWMIRAVG